MIRPVRRFHIPTLSEVWDAMTTELSSPRNPNRELDEFEARLAAVSPWIACHLIESQHMLGKIGRDDALALLAMHTERAAIQLATMRVRVMAGWYGR